MACAGARDRRQVWDQSRRSGDGRALRAVRGVSGQRDGPAFTRGDSVGHKGKFKGDLQALDSGQVGGSADLAGKAMRGCPVGARFIAAEISQRRPVRQRESKGFILRRRHPVRKAGGNQCHGKDGKQYRPVEVKDGPEPHVYGMAHPAGRVNHCIGLVDA